MRGVVDISDPTHYVSLENWKRCFTSKLALLGLMSLTSPTNFHWSLKVVGGETKNADLERLAAEFCVHALVREGKTIHLRRRKYALIDSESHSSDPEELIKWEKANTIKCEGETTKRCVTAMTRCAKDPTTMDYWIPAASLRDSVAAVAKWTTPNGKLQFGLLQLTVSTSCIIDWEVVWRLAHPLITKRSSVCYTVLALDDATYASCCSNPVRITHPVVAERVPVYIARLKQIEEDQQARLVRPTTRSRR